MNEEKLQEGMKFRAIKGGKMPKGDVWELRYSKPLENMMIVKRSPRRFTTVLNGLMLVRYGLAKGSLKKLEEEK